MTDTITVVGNIATNPEQRTAGPVPVTSFRVATSERRLDAQGAWVDAHTNYYTVSAFRSLATHAFASLRRGDRVVVSGRLRLKEWTAADGSKARTIEIEADALGHDLRFGTTVFAREPRGEGSAVSEQGSVDATSAEWSTGSVRDAWAAPGVDDATDAAAAPGSDDDAGSDADRDGERALVLTGAGTPF